MDYNTHISSMETRVKFLDLSDANDDERQQALAIICSRPPNGVEFPFDFSPLTPQNNASTESESSSVRNASPPMNAVCNSSSCSPAPQEVHNYNSDGMQVWDMSVSSGNVMCAPPQYVYQSGPHYFATNNPIPYFPVPANGNVVTPVKENNKMRSNSKIAKSMPVQAFYSQSPNQYQEAPPMMDGSRAPPSTIANIVSEGLVAIPNGPPLFTPSFMSPPFLSPPQLSQAAFPSPQLFLISTPNGSFISYGMPPGMQLPQQSPQQSNPPSRVSVHNNSSNSNNESQVKACHVPSSQHNESVSVVSSVECEVIASDMTDNVNGSGCAADDSLYDHSYEHKSDDSIENSQSVNDSEVNSIPENNANNMDTKTTNTTSLPSVSSHSSYTSTNCNTNTVPNARISGGSQRSWADLFKEGSNHNSLMTSSLSSNASDISTVVSNYNNSYENNIMSDNSKNNDSDAQITSIPMRDDPFAKKLAKKMKEITLKHSLPFLIPCGLVNRGNWCYINSTLQALLGCPPFYNLMREIGEIDGIFRDKSSTPIIDSFAKYFSNYMPCEQSTKKQKVVNALVEDLPKGEPMEPRCIYDVLGSIKSECLKGRQEDAEEFLSSVLNGLHEEMIALFKLNTERAVNGDHFATNGHIERNENGDDCAEFEVNNEEQENNDYDANEDVNDDDDSNLWKEVGPRHKAMPTRSAKIISTPIFSIFGGSTLSVRTAGKDVCGNRQPFFALQLDIQSDKIKSVEDALKYLTASESIQGYVCPKTRQAMDASAQTFLDTLPPILILHLKLFVYDVDGGCRKLMKRIDYPIDLELPRESLHYDKWEREKNNSLKRYKLLSVVYHDGAEAVKGHYITDAYHIGSNQWLRCDDGTIKVIPLQKVLNTDNSRVPYLLFYRRYDTLYAKNSSSSKQ